MIEPVLEMVNGWSQKSEDKKMMTRPGKSLPHWQLKRDIKYRNFSPRLKISKPRMGIRVFGGEKAKAKAKAQIW